MQFSINNYYGEQISKCGYCKRTECSVAHGMHAYTMCPQDYQDLIDRGWRRSGHYLYKPNNNKTCCPLYTIKCDALEFNLSKSHKKVLKRMNRFLRDGQKDKNEEPIERTKNQNADFASECGGVSDEPKEPQGPIPEVNLAAVAAANPQNTGLQQQILEEKPKSIAKAVNKLQATSSATLNKPPPDMPNPPCKKAKQMRLERKQAKLAAKGIEISNTEKAKPVANQGKTLSDFINETGRNDKHKLKLELINVDSKQFADTLNPTYTLYQKYQTRIHNDPPETVKDYLDFLQRSPLQHLRAPDGPTDGYGSFHQQYWLDDKLIAVAVIDILPYCVSSVYFFYDPDYSFLSLGTYGSLREIEYVQQLSRSVPALKYYYMGFYIHSCPKMRYKGKLAPSYLLCPETYTWILLTDELRAKLDEQKYLRFNQNPATKDEDAFSAHDDIDKVLLLVENNKCVSYRTYIQITGEDDDRDTVIEYGKLVGKKCAHRMLYLKI